MKEKTAEVLDASLNEYFSNRSQKIEYCVKQVLAMEKYEKKSIEFLIDFLNLIEKHPELIERFKEFAKSEIENNY